MSRLGVAGTGQGPLAACAALAFILLGLSGAPAGADIPPPLAFGVTTGIPNGRLTRLTQIQDETGARVSLVNWFQSFATDLLVGRARAVLDSGRTPIVSWQPVVPRSAAPSELLRIIAGSDDGYIARFAQAVSMLPGLVWIRFAPEMNGGWEPWGVGSNGNTASELVAAWQHVHQLFTEAGVTNVRWFWCPNVPTAGQAPLSDLYPGDAYVDVVGLDGYNFGRARPGYTWRSYDAIFAAGLQQLQQLSVRPVVLGEVATVHDHGLEGPWIRNFLRRLDASLYVRGFIWFDVAKQINTRIDATARSLNAFRLGFEQLRRGIARNAVSALRSG